MLDVIFNSVTPQGAGNTKKGDGEVTKVAMDPNMAHWIWLTYYEIYNDKIFGIPLPSPSLLSPSDTFFEPK